MANNIYKNIKTLLQELRPKYADVVASRFGIDTKEQTLEAIGKRYSITRERVRQIEEKALSILRNEKNKVFLDNEFVEAYQILEGEGKIAPEDYLIKTYGGGGKKGGALVLLFNLGENFEYHKGDKSFHPHWHIDKSIQNKALSEIRDLEEKLNRKKDLFIEKEMLSLLSHKSFIRLSKKIVKNPLGKYGLSHWSEVSPRGMKDKAYLVLKKHKKPMHFRNIAEDINGLLVGRKALEQTVHNELIKDERFILVGRGIYALKEWGFEPGNVKNIITQVLKASNKPLTKEEIIKGVLKNRLVKDSTIILNLNNTKEFVKLKSEKYRLKAETKTKKPKIKKNS